MYAAILFLRVWLLADLHFSDGGELRAINDNTNNQVLKNEIENVFNFHKACPSNQEWYLL